MMTNLRFTIRSHFFSLLLISSIILGAMIGYWWGDGAKHLKPFGDIFLNLIFTAIVPLIFFSIASAIAGVGSPGKLGKILSTTFVVFIVMSILVSLYAIGIVKIFPPGQGVHLSLAEPQIVGKVSVAEQVVGIFTVPNFSDLLTQKNILALIVFSLFVGIAVTQLKNDFFTQFLKAGENVSMKVFSFIMYYAPIGFFAYFAYLVSSIGPMVMTTYFRIAVIYYCAALFYYFVMLTVYAYFTQREQGVRLFWKSVFIPSITALATCSSAASIPANLMASKQIGIPKETYETIIPLGAIIHKEGSVIGGIFKIAFLFGVYHLDFSGFLVFAIALGVSLLVGTVMGAIPSGGMLGELLILSVYGFPPSVLMAIAAISIIIDPLATLLNVTFNISSSLLVTRFLGLNNKTN